MTAHVILQKIVSKTEQNFGSNTSCLGFNAGYLKSTYNVLRLESMNTEMLSLKIGAQFS